MLGVPAKEAMERAREALVKVQIADPASVLGPLPASALRRHAAARRDRDGAREGARAADPRRADDGPRCDRRGRGARSRLEPPVGVPHRRPLHQPQPRRDLEDVRAASASSTRAGSSRRGRSGRCSRIRDIPYTVGLLRCIPRGGVRKDKGRLDTIPGFLPSLGADDPGLRLRRPLRARRRPLPHRGAGADRAGTGPPRPLLLPGSGAGPPARGGRESRAPGDRPHGRAVAHDRRSREGLPAARARRSCARRRQRRDLAGRDPRARRRVRQRQDHARPDAARDRAADDGIRDPRRGDARADATRSARATTSARSRSSSRIPIRRSTGVTPCSASCCAR